MPRNGQGVYSLPPVYEAVTGETIEAQQHNVPLEDIASDLNQPRSVATGGTGGASAAQARDNLSVYSKAEADAAVRENLGAISTKNIPIDADAIIITDSADSGKTKRILWSRVKASLKAYFDTIYQAALGYTPVNKATDTMTGTLIVSASPNDGGVELNSGTPNNTGLVAFRTAANVRAGYIGFGGSGVLGMRAENGFRWNMSGGLTADDISVDTLNINSSFAVKGNNYPALNIRGTDNSNKVNFIYDHLGGGLIVRLGGSGSNQLIYNGSDQLRLSGGGGLNPDGNLVGTVWNAWATGGAFNAISARIESRGAAYSNTAIAAIPSTIAAMAIEAIGSYALLYQASGQAGQGETVSGASLRWASADGNVTGSSALTGTWICCGRSITASNRVTVWKRVS